MYRTIRTSATIIFISNTHIAISKCALSLGACRTKLAMEIHIPNPIQRGYLKSQCLAKDIHSYICV